MTYSKSQSRAKYNVSKNKPLLYHSLILTIISEKLNRLFQNPFSCLPVYHFIMLLETWIFIQCSIVFFYLWTVIGFVPNQLFCYHIGKAWYFLKSDILNKSFRKSSDQSSVVMKNLHFFYNDTQIHI